METLKTIIDTDILIDLLRDKKEAIDFLHRLESEDLALCTTTINIFELHHGAHKSKEPEKNILAINKISHRLIILPLSYRSAQKAGHAYTELERKGQTIGIRDTFIAAIALTRECSIATRNVEHFSKIYGLKIIPF
jgi:tRNA(fMet)-specific endonuclease VapC